MQKPQNDLSSDAGIKLPKPRKVPGHCALVFRVSPSPGLAWKKCQNHHLQALPALHSGRPDRGLKKAHQHLAHPRDLGLDRYTRRVLASPRPSTPGLRVAAPISDLTAARVLAREESARARELDRYRIISGMARARAPCRTGRSWI